MSDDFFMASVVFGVCKCVESVFLLQLLVFLSLNKKFQRKIVNIFLPLIFSICFGCLKELSH